MCLSSVVKQNSQIERYVENGMPQKIIKTVEYTLKKRAAEQDNNSTKTVQQKPKMCGRFSKMQQQQQLQTQVNKVKTPENSCTDVLAWATQKSRKCIQQLHKAIAKLQQHKLYTVLTKTTQPAHLVGVCLLVLLMLTIGPHLIDNRATPTTTTKSTMRKSFLASASNHIADEIFLSNENFTSTIEIDHNNNNHKSYVKNSNNKNTLAMVAYLAAFATHFGSQIWMTFVSGLSLYFSLPRHIFGQCQQILFPKYFALNAILSITMLILFVKYLTRIWTTATFIQFGALALCSAIEVIIRFYLAPPMLRLMHEKYKIEGAIGSGQEVGTLVQGDLAQCPHYQRIHKMFKRIHMTIAIGNMIVLLATCLQLYFLAAKIQIS